MKSVFLGAFVAIFSLMSCTKESPTHIGAIYSTADFTVYTDRVEQDGKGITIPPSLRDESELRATSQFPEYHSDQPLIDVLYSLAIKEISDSIASANLPYSTYLSLAALSPHQALLTLKKSLTEAHAAPEISQPDGIGGGWPVTTDRISWAMAIW